jgi:Fe-S cluster assembly protein SufD
VFCTHGSTTGKLNKDELLYLQTRGLNKEVAEKLMIQGFVTDLFSRMQKLGIKDEIKNYINEFNWQ